MYTPDNRFEIPDPVPVEKPVGWKAPENLQSMIQRLVRTQISQAYADSGEESLEEANDFDCGDEEPLPFSGFEVMPEELPPGYLPDASMSPQAAAKAVQATTPLQEGSDGPTSP